MKKFEYKILATGMQADIESVNKVGEEGWELVCVQQVGANLNHYFKRELKYEKPRGKK